MLPISSLVVARLCDELPRKSQGPTCLLMYTVYMDNYFSSIKLFKILSGRDIDTVGTLRSNSGGFPKYILTKWRPEDFVVDVYVKGYVPFDIPILLGFYCFCWCFGFFEVVWSCICWFPHTTQCISGCWKQNAIFLYLTKTFVNLERFLAGIWLWRRWPAELWGAAWL